MSERYLVQWEYHGVIQAVSFSKYENARDFMNRLYITAGIDAKMIDREELDEKENI